MTEPLQCRTISRTAIPAPSREPEGFPLNALDHAMVEGLVEVVCLYRQTLDPSRFEQSLRSALRDFSILCGRLRARPDGTFSVEDTLRGISFAVCDCNLSLSAVTSGMHRVYAVYDFIDGINPLLLTRLDHPLLAVRLTRLAGGGCAVARAQRNQH